jgi:hypothetical protein
MSAFFLSGCSKEQPAPPPPTPVVDNDFTRTATHLHNDVDRARDAADIANKVNAEMEKHAVESDQN